MKHLIGYVALILCGVSLTAAPRVVRGAEVAAAPQLAHAGDATPPQPRNAADGSARSGLSIPASTNPFAPGDASHNSNPYLRNADSIDARGPYHTWSGYRAE
jgi:hypothetical protein